MNNILKKDIKVVVLIYAELQGYPPTINAINALKDRVKSISVLYRPTFKIDYPFNEKITLQKVGANFGLESQMKGNIFVKLFLYLSFLYKIIEIINKNKPNLIVVYDSTTLAIFRIAEFFVIKNYKIWYHNHDILNPSESFLSSSFWVSKIETDSFKVIDIFTLPSKERELFFPLNTFKGKYYFLPNFPSKEIYNSFYQNRGKRNNSEFHILYQGSICEGHGLENIIPILGFNSAINKKIFLNLKGIINKEYRNELLKIAIEFNVSNFVVFHGYTPYSEVPKLASKCQLGVAIFTNTDIMNSTLGSSSNKIYEYAAVGTPVVYFDNSHFKKYLSGQKWAFPSDLSRGSILAIISEVDINFEMLSYLAHDSYNKEFNYELYITPIIDTIL